MRAGDGDHRPHFAFYANRVRARANKSKPRFVSVYFNKDDPLSLFPPPSILPERSERCVIERERSARARTRSIATSFRRFAVSQQDEPSDLDNRGG